MCNFCTDYFGWVHVQVADKRIAQLQVSLETADREKEELQQVLQGLRQQVQLSLSLSLSQHQFSLSEHFLLLL